jgi:hypothetical protein
LVRFRTGEWPSAALAASSSVTIETDQQGMMLTIGNG